SGSRLQCSGDRHKPDKRSSLRNKNSLGNLSYIRSNSSSWESSSCFHNSVSTSISFANDSLLKFFIPVQSISSYRGIQPMGLSTDEAQPLILCTIHLSTRMFSPKPGHKNPSLFFLNQFTPNMRGALERSRPNCSQWFT